MQHQSLHNLTEALSKLPGLGRRSARKVMLHLIKDRTAMISLSELLRQTAEIIKVCKICGNIDVTSPCAICLAPDRDQTLMCIVESISALWAIEQSKTFSGLYHVIGGTISALDGRMPSNLNLDELQNRFKQQQIQEVILAINSDVEGQVTAHYIAKMLAATKIRITHLAYGIPIGAELEYVDESTIGMALKLRQNFDD